MSDGSVLLVEIARGTLSRVTPDGRIHVVSYMGGGPNGAALGPDGLVYVCNNGGFRWTRHPCNCHRPIGQSDDYKGGRIERVDLGSGRFERVIDSVGDLQLRGPNDIVFDADGGFYFTDQGKVREYDMDLGSVNYVSTVTGVAHTIARRAMTPNGVALSPDGRTLYYAETEGARVWAFNIGDDAAGRIDREPWPSPHGGRMIAASPGGLYQRFDSMAVDVQGNLHVATLMHGGITIISPHDGSYEHIPLPDYFPTNICFGGLDMRTAYITLSGTGRLIAIENWPYPGLPLNYQ